MAQTVPNWIIKKLSQQQADSITEAVKKAELTTSGEIVPVIVQRSSTVGHIPLILLPFSLLIGMFALNELNLSLSHSAILAINLISSLIITRILSPIPFIERLLTPRADQEQQVILRAELEFYESDIQKTEGQTGILIFVSLMEHMVVVLGDKSISDKLPSSTWDDMVKIVVTGIKKKNLADGMLSGISTCSSILSEHFPVQAGDVNELPNELTFKER